MHMAQFVLLRATRLTVPLLLLITVNSSADPISTVFDTSVSWNGTSSSGPIAAGQGHSRAFGQTFFAPADSLLQSFSFWLESALPLELSGAVMQWNVDRVSGPVLYQQTVQMTSALSAFTRVTFNTAGLVLTSGLSYMLLLDTSADVSANLRFGLVGDDPFPGGGLFGAPWGATFDELGDFAWDERFCVPCDATFAATFSAVDPAPVPEPSTFILMWAGAVIVASGRRRFRQRTEPGGPSLFSRAACRGARQRAN